MESEERTAPVQEAAAEAESAAAREPAQEPPAAAAGAASAAPAEQPALPGVSSSAPGRYSKGSTSPMARL